MPYIEEMRPQPEFVWSERYYRTLKAVEEFSRMTETEADMEPVQISTAAIDAANPLLPVVRAQVQKLAEIPPGPEAQSKVAEILSLIQAIVLSPAVAAIIPPGWKPWIAAAVVVFGLIGSFTAGRVTAPVPPAPLTPWTSNVPVEKPPVTVNVHPPAPVPPAAAVPDVKPHPVPSPIVPTAAAPKLMLTLYVLAETAIPDVKRLEKLPATVSVDPKDWPADAYVPFGGKSVLVPCAVLSRDGVALEVAPFTSAADLEALVERHVGDKK